MRIGYLTQVKVMIYPYPVKEMCYADRIDKQDYKDSLYLGGCNSGKKTSGIWSEFQYYDNEDDTILAYMNKKLNSTPGSRDNLEMIVELLKEYGAVLE